MKKYNKKCIGTDINFGKNTQTLINKTNNLKEKKKKKKHSNCIQIYMEKNIGD
jgi:hypothetical protein